MDIKIFWKGFWFGITLSVLLGIYAFYSMITPTEIELNKIELVDLSGNKYKNASLLSGKPLVLNFWATWCAPCVAEFPEFEVANKKFGDKINFVMVSDENLDKIMAFKNKKSFNLNILKSNVALNNFGINSIPVTYFYDKNGKLNNSILGSLTKEDLEKNITELLK